MFKDFVYIAKGLDMKVRYSSLFKKKIIMAKAKKAAPKKKVAPKKKAAKKSTKLGGNPFQ